METGDARDEGIGFGLLFAVLGLVAAAGLAATGLSGDQLGGAVAFAVAVVAGCLSITALHVYE